MNAKDIFWYPPAETKLSRKAMYQTFMGRTSDFPMALSAYLGAQHVILGDSGRGLLAGLLKALKKRSPEKTEVLMPGYTCYSVAASVANAGLKIRLYDIDPESLAPDMSSFEKCLGKKTLAAIVQHLFGIPVKMDDIQGLLGRAGVWLIEDAAQALGGSVSGKLLGTVGDFGLYSFGRGKPLPLGCGGALAGRDPAILNEINPGLRSGGRVQIVKTASVRILSSPFVYGIFERLPLGLGRTEFNPDFSLRPMPERISALGALCLENVIEMNEHRRRIASIYSKSLQAMRVPETGIAVFPRFPVMAGSMDIPQGLTRLGVRRMYPKSVADEPGIVRFSSGTPERLDGSRKIAGMLITLPTHGRISPRTAREIADGVKKAYKC